MSTGFEVKKGATLQLMFAVAYPDGTAFDFTGVTIASEIRVKRSLELVATLPVVTTATPGQLSLTQATDTWSVGAMVMDLKLSQSGVVLKTATVEITVLTPVTA